MDFKYITLEIEQQVGAITLNRPEVLNAFNKEMVYELDQAADFISTDQTVRAVVIIGKGDNFAAGADITSMVDLSPRQARQFSFKDTFNKVAQLEKPVIAAVAGYALGAGCELALASDLCIAADTAKFGLPEITLGIMPGAGGCARLPRLIGLPRAKELIFTGSPINAETALQYGLVNRVVVRDNLKEEAMKLASKIASRPPIAVQMSKKVINNGINSDLKTAVEIEAIAWSDLFSTSDQKEGMQAFIEKRKPQFTGK